MCGNLTADVLFVSALSFVNDFAEREGKKRESGNAFNSSQFERIAKPLCKQNET